MRNGTKIQLGQFQTHGKSWILPQVLEFIESKRPSCIYDPFAGHGHLLRSAGDSMNLPVKGLDIDPDAGWPLNDSLCSIPTCPGALILTNPPYLAKHSASRKRIHNGLEEHYSSHHDLYQLALDKCLQACQHVVAIIPETFINSSYPKGNCTSISILEDNPFEDTDCPVCVACIDRDASSDPMIFISSRRVAKLSALEGMRLHATRTPQMLFNVKSGRIALRAVDMPDPAKPIRFMRRELLDYSPDKIKVTSRLITFIEIPSADDSEINALIARANSILQSYRSHTSDILLSPFKGNTKAGRRRRRLDYRTARAILEAASSADAHPELPLL